MSTTSISLSHKTSGISLGPTAVPFFPSYGDNNGERWARTPIALLERDVYSRFVVFDGKREVCLHCIVSLPSTHVFSIAIYRTPLL